MPPQTKLTIDAFASAAGSTGETRRYLGSAIVTTSVTGNLTNTHFDVQSPTVPGEIITLVATDEAGNTSEVSNGFSRTHTHAIFSVLTPVAPTPRRDPVDSVDFSFTQDVDVASLGVDDFTLTRDGALIPLTNVSISSLPGATFRMSGLAPLTAQGGTYRLTIDMHWVTNVFGEPGGNTNRWLWVMDTTPPAINQVQAVSPNPRNVPVDAVNVLFSERIDIATLPLSNFSLTRSGSGNLLTGAESIALVSGNTYRISGLTGLTTEDGIYTLTVNAAGVKDIAGNTGVSSTKAATWTMETQAPASTLAPISSSIATSLSLSLSIAATDPPSANGTDASGVKSHDIYVSTDGGAFVLWKTVAASATTAPTRVAFLAESNHQYAFRSIARDKAGNVEQKSPGLIEASISVPDLSPPQTQVVSVVKAGSTLNVAMQGSDVGSNGIVLSFDLYVSIDGAPAAKLGTYSAGLPGAGGVYTAQTVYQPLIDGHSHAYRFYSLGKDGGGIMEAAPAAPADVTYVMDTTAPTSSMSALPATTNETSFTLNWGGTDDTGGSGIASYSVFVSENGGPYVPFVIGTQATTARFFAQAGKTYRFYSVATDVSGNTEAAPSVADAATTVAYPLTVTAGPNQSVAEGDLVSLPNASFTAAAPIGQLVLTIDWGDGTIEPGILIPGTSGGTLANTHRYAHNGNFNVTLTLSDGSSAVSSQAGVAVANIPPTVGTITGPTAAARGQVISCVVPFVDVGMADVHTAIFDWGDGTTSVGNIAETGGAGYASASHVYTNAGNHSITVTITDDGLASASTVGNVFIAAALLEANPFDPTKTDLVVGAHFRATRSPFPLPDHRSM